MLDEHDGEMIAELDRICPVILETSRTPMPARPGSSPPSTPIVIPTIILFCINPQRRRSTLGALDTPLRLEAKQGEATFTFNAPQWPENPD